MPNVCVKICCPTKNVTNNITPQHLVTYVPSASNADTNISSVETLVENRLVKLRRKN